MSLTMVDKLTHQHTPIAIGRSVADYILEQLAVYGVKRIYGVVGDGIFGLADAISTQTEIEFIAVKHESTAAMMASAEAKLTGRLGVCAATMGPGIANLLNGLGDASQDRAPVLAITGQAPLEKIGTDYKQYVDQQSFVRPFASYTTLVAHPQACPEVLNKAIHTALTLGGVAHLSIPKDVFTQPCDAEVRMRPTVIRGHGELSSQDLENTLSLLTSARKPMILAGVGAMHAASVLQDLARILGAGILLSLGAKGTIPENAELVLGGIGQGGNPHAPELFKEADVVLLAGDTWWPEGFVPMKAKVIQIDCAEQNIGKGVPTAIGIVGDTTRVIPQFVRGLREKQHQRKNDEWTARIAQVQEQWRQLNEQEGAVKGTNVAPPRIMRVLEKTLAEDAIVTVDTGNVTVWFNRNFRANGQRILFSGDWRTMGFGLPAALAAKLSESTRQVVAVVGDGGLEMTLADLSTAVRYSLNVTVVVLNNQVLAMEQDAMKQEGLNPTATHLTNPKFHEIALACGWDGYFVEKDEELEPALKTAFASGKPSLVNVMTDPIPFPVPKES